MNGWKSPPPEKKICVVKEQERIGDVFRLIFSCRLEGMSLFSPFRVDRRVVCVWVGGGHFFWKRNRQFPMSAV